MDKVLRKKEIKKANNMDTIKEDVILVNKFLENVCPQVESKGAAKAITTLPLIKCREMLPKYKDAFFKLAESFGAFEKNETMELLEAFYRTFQEYDDVQTEFAELLIEFGEFVPAYIFEELPEKFMLEHDEFSNNTFIENCRFSLDILSIVNNNIDAALDNADKSKCMALSPIITGCSYNIFHVLEIHKKNPGCI